MISLALILLSVLASLVLAQDNFNGTNYNPSKLTCATAEWFDRVSHDPNYAGILRPETDVWYCRYNCNADDYNLSYWQTSSGMCYCSLEQEVPADEVGQTTSFVDGCWSGTNARLDDLRADFSDESCTADTLGFTPFLTLSAPTILGCIGGCGYPPSLPNSYIFTAATPRYDFTMQEYNYLCQCFDELIWTYDHAIACGPGTIHWFERDRFSSSQKRSMAVQNSIA